MHTYIEKLRFFYNIPKTYKTDHWLFASVLSPHHKTMVKTISHLLGEHIFRPWGEGSRSLYGKDFIQILDIHFLNGTLIPFHFAKTRGGADEAKWISGIPSDSIIPSRLS